MRTLHDLPLRFLRPRAPAACVALHPDGDQLFSASTREGIAIWSLGMRRRTGLLPTSAKILQMVVEPGGKRLFTRSAAGLTCWDLASQRPAYVVADRSLQDVTIRFTAAGLGRMLTSEGTKLTLWDLATGARIRRFEGGSQSLRHVVLSLDARHVLAVDAEGTLRRFDVEIGSCFSSCLGAWAPSTYNDPTMPLVGLALHPDGRHVLTTTLVDTLLWDTERGRHVWKTSGPSPRVEAAIFQPGGPLALLEGHNGDLEIWDLQEGRARRPPGGPLGAFRVAAFCKDLRHIVACGLTGRSWQKIHVESGFVRRPEDNYTSTVRLLLPHPDGRRLITADDDDVLTIWGLPHASCISRLDPMGDDRAPREPRVVMSALHTRALTADELGRVSYWDTHKGTSERVARFREPIRSLGFHDEGRRAFVDFGGKMIVLDLMTTEPVETAGPEGHEGVLAAARERLSAEIAAGKVLAAIAEADFATLDQIALHPDGDRVLGARSDRVYLWSLARRELLHTLDFRDDRVMNVAFDPRGDRALLVMEWGLQIRDLETGAIVDTWKPEGWPTDAKIISASIGTHGLTAVTGAGRLLFLVPTVKAPEPTLDQLGAPITTAVSAVNPASPPRNGKRFKPWLEDLAAAWVGAGRRPADLLGWWDVSVAACWRLTDGGQKEGLSGGAVEFVERSFKAHEASYHGLLATRETCRGCDLSYRVENLSLCTHCQRLVCHRCTGELATHENGNRRCGCKWDGERVG